MTIIGTLVLLKIIGAVSLLLWGTQTVRRSLVHAYGPGLRQAIHNSTNNRFKAFGTGMFVTALLQSSTASIVLITSFAKKNLIALPAAIAFVIGSDLATTLVAQVLAFDVSWLPPFLITVALVLHTMSRKDGRQYDIAHVLLGLGLILLSLSLIREASGPLKQSDILPVILPALERDPLFAILLASLLTWVIHSSLASILLFASFVNGGLMTLDLGIWMVVGANIGGALIPLGATYRDGPQAWQITVGNLFMRIAALTLCVPLIGLILEHLSDTTENHGRWIINLHMGFNIAVFILFMPLVNYLAEVFKKLLPLRESPHNDMAPLYLDEKALDSPAVALSGAARETLRIAEIVESMLEQTIRSFQAGNNVLLQSIRRQDDLVDALYKAIKLYLIRVSAERMDETQGARYLQILTFATNLEHIGDIIDKSMMELADKKLRKQEEFSEEGFREIKGFHDQIMSNMRLSQAVFMSGDRNLAMRLIKGKKEIRETEQESSEQHFRRLQKGLHASMVTSSLHLDIIRDYRRINSYLTRVAFSVLDEEEDMSRNSV